MKPCPSRPSGANSGQYYGDPDTQLCVLSCPDKSGTDHGITFADDTISQCVA